MFLYVASPSKEGEGPLSIPSCRSMAWSRTLGFVPIPAVRRTLIEPWRSTPSGHVDTRADARSRPRARRV